MKKKDIEKSNLLTQGAQLNFQVFSTLEIESRNLEFLHLTSSAILSGRLKNVCFYNASFFSTKLINLFFIDCNLKNSDLCSIWVSNCYFHNTDLSNATISDSTFTNCTFDRTIFKSISLTRCQFVDCIFEQLPIDDSTCSLNTFIRCQIKETHFTESFYYQIFNDCIFYNVKMDSTLLGFNFGFSLEVLNQLATKNDLQVTSKNFIEKKLYINAAILQINQIQNYYDKAMIACVIAIRQMIQKDILIKADEIEFLKNLTLYFLDRKQIAPISILRIWQLLNNEIINMPQNIATNKAMPLIREYANMLYFDFIEFQKKLQDHLQQFPSTSDITDTAELKIVYWETPQLPLLNYLVEFSNLVSSDCPTPSLIRTEKGSFIEYHEIAVAILPYLQTLFSFLGVVTPIIIYKKQKHDHEKQTVTSTDKRKEAEIIIETQKNKPSPIFLPNINDISLNTNTITTDVIKILASQPLENYADFCGYNNHNIQSITIKFH